MTFRCTLASLGRGEDLVGTASTGRAFLVVEHKGPWGVDALHDARMPAGDDAARDRLRQACVDARVRPLLVRRPRGSTAQSSGGIRVFAAWADAHRPWMETAVLRTWEAVAALDIGALGRGRSPGLEPTDEPVVLVCTHGRHDVCCAEQGRPVAAALAASHPEQVWESSHVGGDRYAPTVVALPSGAYHGRVAPEAAPEVVDRILEGRLTLSHLRGRSGLRAGVQAAEHALRAHLDEDRVDALRVLRWQPAPEGPGGVAHLGHASGRWAVTVTATRRDPAPLTCRAGRASVAWRWGTALTPLV